MPRLGLVTILYKSDDVLEDFFRSLSLQTYRDFTLYMVDNSASPETDSVISACLKKYSIPQFEYIDSKANIGVAAGNNIGIKIGRAHV